MDIPVNAAKPGRRRYLTPLLIWIQEMLSWHWVFIVTGGISKDGYFIFGGAYPMKDGQTRFTTLKEKMSAFQFQFGKTVKSEKCTVLFPSRWQDFVCGKDNAFLIGEAAGFISASSLEGISYALDSADILRSVLLKQPEKLNTAYWRATRKLRLKLFGKIVKSRCLTAPALRKWIMRSGVAHIPQLKD